MTEHQGTQIPTWDGGEIACPLAKRTHGLLALPAVIDPHVHFRAPGEEEKEDWITGARAALAGGVTTLFDMPNNRPPCVDETSLWEKHALIACQLEAVGIPLRYRLYLGATRETLPEIEAGRLGDAIAIKLFMGSSTGSLLMDTCEDQARLFSAAARWDIPVAVHAEDESIIAASRAVSYGSDPAIHSLIRPPEAAEQAVARAIGLAEKYGTRLYILHVSTEGEIEQIYQAKKRGVRLLAEATPHHLFLDDQAYGVWGTVAQVNPPLRGSAHRSALLAALAEGIIDTVGSDHAPHTEEQKRQPYGQAPSGIAGIETLLPLLYTAYAAGKLPLERILAATNWSIARFFRLPPCDDLVVIDTSHEREVSPLSWHSKAKFSPFAGQKLRGWPQFVRLRGCWHATASLPKAYKQEVAV